MDANNVVEAEISVYLLFYSILLSRRVKNHVIWQMPKDYDFSCNSEKVEESQISRHHLPM